VSDVIAGLLEESTAGCVSSSMSRVMGNGCGATKNETQQNWGVAYDFFRVDSR